MSSYFFGARTHFGLPAQFICKIARMNTIVNVNLIIPGKQHYENMPMQYTVIFKVVKNEIFQ